jgi:hypothetical protein
MPVQLPGQYFDGKTSTAHPVEVTLLDNGWLCINHGTQTINHAAAELKISARIGNTPRRIQLPDDTVCEITDNDALDQWLSGGGAHGLQHQVFHLERQWSYALLALLAVVIGAWAFIQYGVPALAERIATHLPTSVDDRLGGETLELMDGKLFQPTQLTAVQQTPIRESFKRIIAALPDKQRYRLEFRQGGEVIGANAFALPSGIVVMTDELVQLADNQNELTAVLAHEVGHVVHRHTLRMVLQNSASALVMFGLLGDVSSVSALAASMPTLLTQAKYSRAHEAEADDYAYAWMASHGIASHYFGDMLNRLEQQQGGSNAALSYFSSHPQTSERSQRAR